MKKTHAIVALGLAAAAGTSALAGTVAPQVLEIDISNLMSFDGLGGVGNDALEIALPAGYDRVIGIGWDVNLETVGPSWASEAAFALGDQGEAAALFLRPAAGVDEPLAEATNFSSALIDLVGLELDFSVASGTLSLELFETFDDVAGEVDANWLSGSTLLVQVIPGPGALALLGMAGVVGSRRRRD